MKLIGIGTDITEIERIERILKRHPDRFLADVFTEAEIRYSMSKRKQGQHLAGRWAAKEAVLKAVGTGWIAGTSWKDIEVINDASGKPEIILTGGVKKIADQLGITQILISISHCDCHAIAYAVATGE